MLFWFDHGLLSDVFFIFCYSDVDDDDDYEGKYSNSNKLIWPHPLISHWHNDTEREWEI